MPATAQASACARMIRRLTLQANSRCCRALLFRLSVLGPTISCRLNSAAVDLPLLHSKQRLMSTVNKQSKQSKRKQQQQQQQQPIDHQTDSDIVGSIRCINEGKTAQPCTQLSIRVKPGAQTTRVTAIDDSSVHISLHAPPRDGEANSELLRYLSSVLSVRQAELQLSGAKSRDKTVTILNRSDCDARACLTALQAEVES